MIICIYNTTYVVHILILYNISIHIVSIVVMVEKYISSEVAGCNQIIFTVVVIIVPWLPSQPITSHCASQFSPGCSLVEGAVVQ